MNMGIYKVQYDILNLKVIIINLKEGVFNSQFVNILKQG